MNLSKWICNFIVYMNACLMAGIAMAASDQAPSLFLNVGGGLVTHKSELVESNDTTTSVNYSFGITGSKNRSLSFMINTYSASTAFELNTSSITSSFQDTILRYYMGWFYVGAAFSQSAFEIKGAEGSNIELDALGTGMGGNIGFEFEVGRNNQLFLDILSATTSTVKEINDSDFAIGSRMEISLGGKFPITRRLVNGQVGYTQRTYTLTYDGQSYAELNSITWLGLGFNWYF